jgi:hypothetical protein
MFVGDAFGHRTKALNRLILDSIIYRFPSRCLDVTASLNAVNFNKTSGEPQ